MGGTLPQSYGTSLAIWHSYLPPDTSERAPRNPSHAGWYSIYLPWRDGRLSWPSWLDSAPAGSWTSDLLITSMTPNHCTTKTTVVLPGLLNLLLNMDQLADTLILNYPVIILWNNTHDTCSRNHHHKSTPFSGIVFKCQFSIPYASEMKISVTKK